MTSGKKIPPAVTLGMVVVNKDNNKITKHRAIFQRERQNPVCCHLFVCNDLYDKCTFQVPC
jgi:hypothetical protein